MDDFESLIKDEAMLNYKGDLLKDAGGGHVFPGMK